MPADAQTEPASGASVPRSALPKAYFNCIETLPNVVSPRRRQSRSRGISPAQA